MIWGIGSAAITLLGQICMYRIGKRAATREATNAVGAIMPGGIPMAAFVLGASKIEGEHQLNGTIGVLEDGEVIPGRDFTIAHPAGCNFKRCPTTKALKRYGNLVHVTIEP